MSKLNDEFWFKTDDGNQIRLFKIYKEDSLRKITGCADGGVTITEVDSAGSTETGNGARGIFDTLSDSAQLNTTSEGDPTADSDIDEDGGSDREGADCFLSSACLSARGHPDTCEELTILRHFRDSYMITTEHNRRLIDEYYNIAPSVVININKLPNAEAIWSEIYEGLVVPTMDLVKKAKFEEAIEHYRLFTTRLAASITES